MRLLCPVIVLIGLLAAPAAARHDARPRVLHAAFPAQIAPGVEGTLDVVGRDRDGVIRGYEADFGDGARIALSACDRRRPRAGRRARFTLPYAYAAPGTYTITVAVLSGGCRKGERRRRSKPVTLSVVVA